MAEKLRVLVIDDERDIVRGMCLRLRAVGHDPLAAHDPREGLRATIEYHPDVIVLDIRMPGMTGLELLEILQNRNDTRAIPVVVVSANVVETTRDQALTLGARHFLAKPYQARELISAIESVARNPSEILRVGDADAPAQTALHGGQFT